MQCVLCSKTGSLGTEGLRGGDASLPLPTETEKGLQVEDTAWAKAPGGVREPEV